MLAREVIGKTAKEILGEYLDRVERLEPQIRALVRLNPQAQEEASWVDERTRAGQKLPLAGVPVVLKDNICTKGLHTTCASKMLENFVPPYDATVVERLRAAGAVVLAKANMDEFAMGSSTEYSAFGPTYNPWNTQYVPGGTSGGSAAAVAADFAPLALGTDTGGSVRQPAAFCGVYGFKPTYGRVSRYGIVAHASSLDQVGGLARSIEDLAMLADVICVHDPLDSTSLKATPSFVQALSQPVAGMTIGVVRQSMQVGNTPGVNEAVERLRQAMEKQGVQFIDIDLPILNHALATYYTIDTAEVSSNLARYDGTLYGLRVDGKDITDTMQKSREQGLGPEVQRRIMMGTFVLSAGYYDAYYAKALRARAKLKSDFMEAFSRCDALLTPTSPFPAFKFGEKTADPVAMYLADIDTVAVNLMGGAAISIPAGFENGLPVGVQLIARPLQDEKMFSLAKAFEEATSMAFVQVAQC
jgi:aspartyl-tRNA(Asn)/glutamyl-tRNA(Gln) amidotransferase subunit A